MGNIVAGLLIDGTTKTVKHEKKNKKKQEGGFLVAMMASVVAMFWKEVMKAGKRQKGGFLPLLALPLIVKVLGKVVTPAGTQRPEDVPYGPVLVETSRTTKGTK